MAKEEPDRTQLVDEIRRLPGRQEVATIVAVDAFGIIFTAVAAVVLAATQQAASGWWVVVGLAALLAVVTTVALVRLVSRRRTFVTDAENLIKRLNQYWRQQDENPPSEVSPRASHPSPELVRFARNLRAEALAMGEVDVAGRLDMAIERYPPGFGEAP